MRVVRPAFRLPTTPLSRKFGFDRGTPIDRFFIDSFLKRFGQDIHGHGVEIGDSRYLTLYGGSFVTKKDVIDINRKNKKATIIGDLKNLSLVRANTFDIAIVTHVLGMIDDPQKAIQELHRILKPGGVLLATTSCLGPTMPDNQSLFRIMPEGARALFSTVFTKKNVEITTMGNYQVAVAFLSGMSLEEVDREVLTKSDPMFPCVVGIRAIKTYE